MKSLRHICGWLFWLIIPASGISQVKDTLFFFNGDILIGELKSISLGRVSFDDDNMDVLSIKVNKIKALKATTHIYRLETINGEIYYSTLEAGSDGMIQIMVHGNVMEVSVQDISDLSPLKGKTGGLWQGNGSAGYSYSKSTGLGQINSNINLEYLSRKIDIALSGSTILNQTDSTLELNNATGGLANSYLFTSVWEANVFFIYQRNLEQGLKRRYQEGLGGGCNFVSTVSLRAKVVTGIVFNQEESIEDVKTPTQVDIPVILNFNFFRFHKPDMTVNLKQNLFIGLTDKGRIRQDGQLTVNWKLFGDFGINLQFYHNFDNRPPGQNSEKLDYGVVIGLSYKFSQ